MLHMYTVQARQVRVTVKKKVTRKVAISATYYFPVSFKEQKQPCDGVKPGAKGRAHSLPMSQMSPSPSFSISPFLCLSHPLGPPCPLLIILG